jgi:small redox-active disulfide protein 2
MEEVSLLAIFAHPDDESNAAGGTLARYAREGADVTLVSATRGESGIAGLAPEAAGVVRERELRAAGIALGARDVRFLGYRDGELGHVDEKEAVARIGALLREIKPQVVVTFGPDGISGHADHIAVSRWVTTAFDEVGVAQKLYYVAPSRATQQACGVPPPRELVGGPIAAIDVGQDLQAKVRAIQCHASQSSPTVDAAGLECHEYFRLARSRVSALEDETDLLAGIVPSASLVVKILGVGCARCHALEHEVRAVVRERGLAAEVVRVEDFFEMMRYRPLASPGLVVNERLVCAGRVPSRDEIVAFLQNGVSE